MKHLGPREVSSDRVKAIVNAVADFFAHRRNQSVCFVFGLGGQRRNTYSKISEAHGVTLRAAYSCLPKGLKSLQYLVPSYAGVIEVSNPALIAAVFDALDDSTLVGICVLNLETGDEFLRLFKMTPHPKQLDNWFLQIREAVFYELDPDNPDSRTGMHDWLVLGDHIPNSIVVGFENLWLAD